MGRECKCEGREGVINEARITPSLELLSDPVIRTVERPVEEEMKE